MADFSNTEVHKIIKERDRAEGKLAKEKSTAEEYTAKAVVGLAAVATGFGIGVLNAQNGGTAESPYLLGGTVAIDAVAAGLGAVAILATPTRGQGEKFMPLSLGFGAAAIGIWGQRAGYQWQQSRGTTSTTSTATSSGPLPWGSMHTRMAAGGVYGGGPNPYVSAFAGR
jgi:hypothetical protein